MRSLGQVEAVKFVAAAFAAAAFADAAFAACCLLLIKTLVDGLRHRRGFRVWVPPVGLWEVLGSRV